MIPYRRADLSPYLVLFPIIYPEVKKLVERVTLSKIYGFIFRNFENINNTLSETLVDTTARSIKKEVVGS